MSSSTPPIPEIVPPSYFGTSVTSLSPRCQTSNSSTGEESRDQNRVVSRRLTPTTTSSLRRHRSSNNHRYGDRSFGETHGKCKSSSGSFGQASRPLLSPPEFYVPSPVACRTVINRTTAVPPTITTMAARNLTSKVFVEEEPRAAGFGMGFNRDRLTSLPVPTATQPPPT